MKKHRIGVHVEKNAFIDGGDGVISFPEGQVITDTSSQRNGTKYDIESMDLSEYRGQVTADHWDQLDHVIGEALGLAKRGNEAVVISGIRFAVKENALGKLAYDLIVGGFPLDISIETYGPWPDQSDDTYYKAKLVGLSVVVVGNNKSATMSASLNELALNSIAQAKEQGLQDADEAEKILDSEPAKSEPEAPQEPPKEPEPTPKTEDNTATKQVEQRMLKTIKNSRDFTIKVKYKNAAGDEVETELAPGATVDVVEDQAETVETQVTKAEAPKPDLTEAIKEAVNAVVGPIKTELEELKTKEFNSRGKAPEFKQGESGEAPSGPSVTKNKYAEMDWKERTALQLRSKLSNGYEAQRTLHDLNQFHLDQLKEKGIVKNTMTLDTFDDFVLPPEMISEIQGKQSNYRPLLDAFSFQETLRLKMMWLERVGDIDMTDVAMIDAGSNTDLKPIDEYDTNTLSRELTEFAAVTPVDASAIRFSAVDVVADITDQYRRAYDKKLSQSVIGRLWQAVQSNGNTVPFSLAGGEVNGLVSLINAWAEIAEFSPEGTFLLNTSSYARILSAATRAGVSGPLSEIFTSGDVPRFLGRPYILVPSTLLPTLDTPATKTWSFEGDTVTVSAGVLYADPSVFKGRVSGGLNFSMSDEAAYEQGGTVKSAFQRDKVLFRGYSYRASAVTDPSQVSAIGARGVS